MNTSAVKSEIARDETVILQARDSIFGDQAFLCTRGRRHLLLSAERLVEVGFRWPEDLEQTSERMLRSFRPAGPLPSPAPVWPPVDSMGMREWMATTLAGTGLEIGAGASPFPVPLHCRVLYGDRLSYEQLTAEPYPGQRKCDLVVPEILTEFDEISGVGDESLDFLIACHVIEHTRNPIGSIAAAHRKLKPGGQLLLVIPDKEQTFDRDRPVTTLDHLLEDFHRPDRQRDLDHYREFYRLAFSVRQDILEETARRNFVEEYAIHYHVWTHDTFAAMLAALPATAGPWASVWTHPGVGDASNEFYARLVKPDRQPPHATGSAAACSGVAPLGKPEAVPASTPAKGFFGKHCG